MASQKALLQTIKDHFNLNIYEAKIWTALLSRGVSSAGELSEISGVPRSRCYDVLEGLEKKGFIIMKIGKPIQYIAVKPEIILERVKDETEEKARKDVDALGLIENTDAFKELELLHKSGVQHVDVTDISRSIVGRAAINKHLKSMLKTAKESVLVVTNLQGMENCFKALKSASNALQKNSVQPQIYAPHDKRLAKKLQGLGMRHNTFEADTHFVAVDGKEVLFLVSPSSTVPEYETAIWIESPFFAHAITVLFTEGAKA